MAKSGWSWVGVLDQVFAGFDLVENAAPSWLKVPDDARRLMVDRLYPELGVAVRFRRPESSDDLLLEVLCDRVGVVLLSIYPEDRPTSQGVAQICAGLSKVIRHLAQWQGRESVKQAMLPRMAAARDTCQRIQYQLADEQRALVEDASPAMQPVTRFSRWQRWQQQMAANGRRLREGWHLFAENRLSLVGVGLLTVFGLMAIAHPILRATIWSADVYDPKIGFDFAVAPHPSPPSWLPQPNNPYHTPSFTHLLGTDALGHDVLSMLLAATTPAFVIGITAALATAVVSTAVGAVAAYFGRLVDALCMQIADVFLLLPAPLFMVIFGVIFQDIGTAGYGLIYGLVAGLGGAAIVMRSYALGLINRPFIQASRVAGGGAGHIILRHMLPHMLPLAALYMMISVVGAVVADGFISFFGFNRAYLNWGSIIYTSFSYQTFITSGVTWHVFLPSSLALSLFAASFYLIARGLHQIADPRLRGR